MVSRTPTLSTVIAHVDYLEGDNDWGWWCEGWVDPDAFLAECIVQAARELLLRPEEALPVAPVKHGYARVSSSDYDGHVSLNERPNGGHRATYIWGPMS
ncbi:MAG TPA: hypothetical protein VMU89_14925 [Thermomicrobiaceae bacterium]|nr:hypothetical protein [Thermomicrobiaceae bacterium]